MADFCVGRSAVAYWILGLSNAIGYAVLISAAEDILSQFVAHSDEEKVWNSVRYCNKSSSGIILLANIIPSMLVKAAAPFLPLWMNIRILLVVMIGTLGFGIIPIANSLLLTLTGIVLTSFSAGLGESSLLSYTVFFEDKSVLSAWSSGAGGAGLFGSVLYAASADLGLSSQTVLLFLLALPVIMAVCFWALLESPFVEVQEPSETTPIVTLPEAPQSISEESLYSRIQKIPETLKYMAPLFVSYYFVYVINQGLFEMQLVSNSSIDRKIQYRLYQVCYNLGVFIGRSSINWFRIDNLWIMAFFQGINIIFFTFEVLFLVANNVFIISAVVVWEGLLSGASYVNVFYKIRTEERAEDREVMTGFTLVADNLGIAMSGLTVIAIHDSLCKQKRL